MYLPANNFIIHSFINILDSTLTVKTQESVFENIDIPNRDGSFVNQPVLYKTNFSTIKPDEKIILEGYIINLKQTDYFNNKQTLIESIWIQCKSKRNDILFNTTFKKADKETYKEFYTSRDPFCKIELNKSELCIEVPLNQENLKTHSEMKNTLNDGPKNEHLPGTIPTNY